MFTHPVKHPAPTAAARTLPPSLCPAGPRPNCATATLRAHTIPNPDRATVACPAAVLDLPHQRPPLLCPPTRPA